jgi:hypothetical protein
MIGAFKHSSNRWASHNEFSYFAGKSEQRNRLPGSSAASGKNPDSGYWIRRKGPLASAKLLVFKTWMPASWSPSNGVTVPGHPAVTA